MARRDTSCLRAKFAVETTERMNKKKDEKRRTLALTTAKRGIPLRKSRNESRMSPETKVILSNLSLTKLNQK